MFNVKFHFGSLPDHYKYFNSKCRINHGLCEQKSCMVSASPFFQCIKLIHRLLANSKELVLFTSWPTGKLLSTFSERDKHKP